MALKPSAFDIAGLHPLRQQRGKSNHAVDRVCVIAVTVVAHVLAVIAIVAGLRQTQIAHQPRMVTIQIDTKPERKENLPLPQMPAFAKPALINVPVPEISIANPPPSPVAATNSAVPTPPTVSQPLVPVPHPSNAALTWQEALLARLEQAKRYPDEARMRRQQGVVLLQFAMDRDGKVLSASIKKSSGFSSLDQETLALIQRAQPLPKPPAEVTGNPVELVVPVDFSLSSRR